MERILTHPSPQKKTADASQDERRRHVTPQAAKAAMGIPD
jgi:hypothetical protein